MNEKVMLIVSSCDKYKDCWDPFFKLLKKYWNPAPQILLNTETLSYSYPGLDIRTLSLYGKEERPEWSERLMTTLRQVSADYVLLMLDDFFLEKPVNTGVIDQCVTWMDQDPSIAAFCFMPTMHEGNLPCRYPGFEQRPQKGEYRLTCQASLWRKSTLLKDMRPHESAWLFETLGSRRSWRYRDQKFYAAIPGTEIMEYHYPVGAALHRGKWNPYMRELNETENLGIDFSERGFNTDVSGSAASKSKFIRSRLNPKGIMKAVTNRWKSLKW